MVSIPTVILYLAVGGAFAAALKHGLADLTSTLEDLTPISVKDKAIAPDIQWWAGWAFGAMNLGFGSIGAYGIAKDSVEVQRAAMLGTAVVFLAFASLWFTVGNTVRNRSPLRQGTKVAAFGLLFAYGFWNL